MDTKSRGACGGSTENQLVVGIVKPQPDEGARKKQSEELEGKLKKTKAAARIKRQWRYLEDVKVSVRARHTRQRHNEEEGK